MSRFKGKLVKMMKDTNSRFDDYSISPKITQILFHWEYELTESDFVFKVSIFNFFILSCYFFVNINMSYYWFNRQ